jgi:hypothetical protein
MKGVVAGSKLKKKDAYASLADWVNTKCAQRWTPDIAESRYRSYFKIFKDTKDRFEDVSGAKYLDALNFKY